MRVRMLSATGDYTFGQGEANFFINSPAGVGQSVETRLKLWEGEWFLNTTDGTPYSTEILGYGNQSLRDLAIQDRILNTPGVTGITNYDSSVDSVTRAFTVAATITTEYGPTTVNVVFPAPMPN